MIWFPIDLLCLLIGRLARLTRPRFAVRAVLRWFIRRYGVAEAECEHPPESYPSLGEFFTRSLRPGLRPLQGPFVSPVDGTLRSSAEIRAGRIQEVKRQDYAVSELIGADSVPAAFTSGCYYNLYLSPPDYHHVHAPLDFELKGVRHIPGTLWPVNDWSFARVRELFCKNERVVLLGKSVLGETAIVFVGAFNVGSIELNVIPYRSRVTVDPFRLKRGIQEFACEPCSIACGERLGVFHLGSSVVLLFERSPGEQFSDLPAAKEGPLSVKVGERLPA